MYRYRFRYAYPNYKVWTILSKMLSPSVRNPKRRWRSGSSMKRETPQSRPRGWATSWASGVGCCSVIQNVSMFWGACYSRMMYTYLYIYTYIYIYICIYNIHIAMYCYSSLHHIALDSSILSYLFLSDIII